MKRWPSLRAARYRDHSRRRMDGNGLVSDRIGNLLRRISRFIRESPGENGAHLKVFHRYVHACSHRTEPSSLSPLRAGCQTLTECQVHLENACVEGRGSRCCFLRSPYGRTTPSIWENSIMSLVAPAEVSNKRAYGVTVW